MPAKDAIQIHTRQMCITQEMKGIVEMSERTGITLDEHGVQTT